MISFHLSDGPFIVISRVVDDFGNVVYLRAVSIKAFCAALEFEFSSDH